jgi:hypothetical protein
MMLMARTADTGNVLETPYGSNWGNAVKQILAVASGGRINFPTNWCASAITNYLVLASFSETTQAKLPMLDELEEHCDLLIRSGDLPKNPFRVREWSDWAQKKGIWTADERIAKRGDLFLYRKPKWTGPVGHIGWVLERDGGWLRTVEGNLHNGLNRYGEQGSDKHTWRPVKEGFEFVRLSQLP